MCKEETRRFSEKSVQGQGHQGQICENLLAALELTVLTGLTPNHHQRCVHV